MAGSRTALYFGSKQYLRIQSTDHCRSELIQLKILFLWTFFTYITIYVYVTYKYIIYEIWQDPLCICMIIYLICKVSKSACNCGKDLRHNNKHLSFKGWLKVILIYHFGLSCDLKMMIVIHCSLKFRTQQKSN